MFPRLSHHAVGFSVVGFQASHAATDEELGAVCFVRAGFFERGMDGGEDIQKGASASLGGRRTGRWDRTAWRLLIKSFDWLILERHAIIYILIYRSPSRASQVSHRKWRAAMDRSPFGAGGRAPNPASFDRRPAGPARAQALPNVHARRWGIEKSWRSSMYSTVRA